MNIYRYILLLMLLLPFAGCREKYEITPATFSNLLTNGDSKSWKQRSFIFYFDDYVISEYDANLIYGVDDCDQDNEYVFYKKGKQVEMYAGATRCNEDEDLIFSTSWELVNANANFFIGGGDPYTIRKLTEDSLVYEFRDTLGIQIFDDIEVYRELTGVARWVYTAK